jgi:hypothetical protein
MGGSLAAPCHQEVRFQPLARVGLPLPTNSCPLIGIHGSPRRSNFGIGISAVNPTKIKVRGVFATADQSPEDGVWNVPEVDQGVVKLNAKRTVFSSRAREAHSLDEGATANRTHPDFHSSSQKHDLAAVIENFLPHTLEHLALPAPGRHHDDVEPAMRLWYQIAYVDAHLT